jgi:chemotaxis protein CheX
MDVKLINPFISATLHVLETMASTKAEAGKPFLKKNQVAIGDITSVIRLTGDASGTISVSFAEKSFLAIVANMFGEEMKELNDEIGDAVGEIANMISGQARKKLGETGKSLKAAIPTVIMGKNHTICHETSGVYSQGTAASKGPLF